MAEYRRLTGRSGPGAGRPAKIYRRSTRQLAISLPQGNYELLARLLAQALKGGEGASSSAALADAARERGTNLGIQARRQAGARAGRDRLLAKAAAVLNDCGFEAAREDACLCLRNCPFSPLSGRFTEVVCPQWIGHCPHSSSPKPCMPGHQPRTRSASTTASLISACLVAVSRVSVCFFASSRRCCSASARSGSFSSAR